MLDLAAATRGVHEGGEVIVTEHHKDVDVNEAPFPARHLLDNTIYHSFISKYKNFSCFITSRGCPYNCSYCYVSILRDVYNEKGRKFYRARSVDHIIGELEAAQKVFPKIARVKVDDDTVDGAKAFCSIQRTVIGVIISPVK